MIASVVLVVFNVALGIWSNVALEIALVGINVARLGRRTGVDPATAPSCSAQHHVAASSSG